MVGLRIPDSGHGQQNHAGRQQHVEQQSHRFGEQVPPRLWVELVALICAPPSGHGGVSQHEERRRPFTWFSETDQKCVYVIPQVGKAMSSNETAAYEIMKSLDVDYVLIIFGGVIGYSGDDINKFLWMVRIAEGEHPRDIRVRRSWRRWTGNREWTLCPWNMDLKHGSKLTYSPASVFLGKWLLHPAGRVPGGQSRVSHAAQLPDVQNVLLPLRRNAGMSTGVGVLWF